MRLRLLVLVGLVLGTFTSGFPVWASPAAHPAQSPAVQTVPGGLLLEWRTPDSRLNVAPDGTVRILIDGYSQLERAGLPVIPYAAALVALPDSSRPVLEFRRIEDREMALPGEVGLAARPEGVQRGLDGKVVGGAWAVSSPNLAARSAWEASPVVLEELGRLRGVRLARLLFFPARPQGDTLRFTSSVQVFLRFQSAGRPDVQPGELPNAFERLLQTTVINPQDLATTRLTGTGTLPENQVSIPQAGSHWAVEVSQTGLVALSYEGLLSAGLPVESFIPQRLQLERAGQVVAAEWEGDADERFEPGERLLFFAEPRFSRWTASDVWFLSIANGPAARMKARTASPAGLPASPLWVEQPVEQNRLYTPDCFCGFIPGGKNGDRWVWDSLHLVDHPASTYQFDLLEVDKAPTARLDLWLIGSTDLPVAPDHRVEVTLNGSVLGRVEWDGKQSRKESLSFSGSLLKAGSNSLSLSLPGIAGVPIESAWLDAFSVHYALASGQGPGRQVIFGAVQPSSYLINLPEATTRLYDVTDADQPQRLQPQNNAGGLFFGDPSGMGGRRYWLEAGLVLSPDRLRPVADPVTSLEGADYLILAPAQFFPAVEELRSHRLSQGLVTAAEDVQAIYDAFSQGRPDPEGLRAYLEQAYTTWSRPPTYVLLVGDGTSDPRRYQSTSPVTWIPPYLADVDPWSGETAADNRYVSVEGDDPLPEMLIGRLPVNSLEEARNVVSKIVRYETEAPDGSWRRNVLFVADNPDTAGDFPASSASSAAAFIKPPRFASQLYLAPEAENADAVRKALFERWNAGMELLVYSGHASIHQWALEKLIHLQETGGLQNGLKLPVLLEMSCFTAAYHTPGFDTLDESLLRHPAGGIAAAWGPTGLGLSSEHALLLDGFLSRMTGGEAQTTVGEAALAGKIALMEDSPAGLNLVDTFVLLGDPATQFVLDRGTRWLHLPAIQTSPDGR